MPRRPRSALPATEPDTTDLPTCERLWTVQEVSDFLVVPVETLYQWRYLDTGPEAFRVGKHLRYDPDEVRRWLVTKCRGAA
ncbi:MAG: helix-turn-helix domain-containing protein [Actinomycetales bacterium]|nr:helix-turn-helix domain-containing protein [Actinomycetales bacterium]